MYVSTKNFCCLVWRPRQFLGKQQSSLPPIQRTFFCEPANNLLCVEGVIIVVAVTIVVVAAVRIVVVAVAR